MSNTESATIAAVKSEVKPEAKPGLKLKAKSEAKSVGVMPTTGTLKRQKVVGFGIYKQEFGNILRMLESIRDLVDGCVIVDTGSNDGTLAQCEQWAVANGKRMVTTVDPFVDFGHNRTRSLEIARYVFPEADWFLSFDADNVMRLSDGAFGRADTVVGGNPSKLLAHLACAQLNGCGMGVFSNSTDTLSYPMERIFNARYGFRSFGATHEQWIFDDDPKLAARPRKSLETFCVPREVANVLDVCDGGSRGLKVPRDIAMLTLQLERFGCDEARPEAARTIFYLACSWKDRAGELAGAKIADRKITDRKVAEAYRAACDLFARRENVESDSFTCLQERYLSKIYRAECLTSLAAYNATVDTDVGKLTVFAQLRARDEAYAQAMDLYPPRPEAYLCAAETLYSANAYVAAFALLDHFERHGKQTQQSVVKFGWAFSDESAASWKMDYLRGKCSAQILLSSRPTRENLFEHYRSEGEAALRRILSQKSAPTSVISACEFLLANSFSESKTIVKK